MYFCMITPVIIVTYKYGLMSIFFATLKTRRLLLKKWLITVPSLRPDLITVIRDDRNSEKGFGEVPQAIFKISRTFLTQILQIDRI